MTITSIQVVGIQPRVHISRVRKGVIQMTAKNEEYIRVVGGFLEIRQKLGKGKLSTSGKSHNLFSTGGNVEVEGSDGMMLGVNLYKPIPKAERK